MNRILYTRTLIALAVFGYSNQALSAAFQLNEHSASGLGRSFAGEGVIADNASIIARNPAGMALFSTPEMSIAGSYINPDIDVVGATSSNNAANIAPSAFVPAFYYLHPLDKNITLGFGMFSNYGLATKFKDNYSLGPVAGQTKLVSVNLNPNLAYRFNENWNFGFGVNAVYSKAELVRNIGSLSGVTGRPSSSRFAYLKGDDWQFSWNLGVLYEYNDNHRLGFTYRSQVKHDFSGDYTNDLIANLGSTTALSSAKIPASLKVELPAIMEASGYHRFMPQWALHYSVMRVGWSSFDEIRAVNSAGTTLFKNDEKFKNSWRYSLGGSFYGSDDWTLRAGLTYDDSPIPDAYKNISIPDADRIWYSLGGTYQVTRDQSVDLGLTYIKAHKDVELTETIGVTNYELTTKSAAYLLALQWNMAF